MKNNFKFFLAIIGVIFVLSACNKYEEGPSFTLLSKKARISGDWTIEKITSVSGVEQLSQSTEVLSINRNGSYQLIYKELPTVLGNWAFIKEKEYVSLTYKKDGFDNIDEYKIIRLKNKELWLEDVEGVRFNYVLAP